MKKLFRCEAGHDSELEFGDEMKLPCPTCQINVYQFRDQVENVAEDRVIEQSNLSTQTKSILSWDKKLILSLVLVGVVGFGYYASASVKTIPPITNTNKVLPFVQPLTNNVSEISITDFSAVVGSNDTVKISFVLVNHGADNNDFPMLNVHWKGSASKDTTIKNNAYAHPVDKFSRLAVSTELLKPADATGVEITVKYVCNPCDTATLAPTGNKNRISEVRAIKPTAEYSSLHASNSVSLGLIVPENNE